MLKERMTNYTNVSLRKLATELNICYASILKASKQPVANQVYDPDAVNYDAVEECIAKRGKVEALESLNWDALNQVTSRRAATVERDISKFTVGTQVYLRKHAAIPYTIIYTTNTHVVFILEGTEEPICWSWNTFILNGPQFEPRTITATADSATEVEETVNTEEVEEC